MPQPLVPPHLVTPLPRCAVLFDRHIHKNGGTSLRSVLFENDLRDGWLYWGYGLHQHDAIMRHVVSAMLQGGNRSGGGCAHWPASRAHLRLAAEYHYSRYPLSVMLTRFGPSSPLQHVAAQCRCRVVLVTRLREPLSFYASFYSWTVAWRQHRNASEFGASMVEWAPRNLQATIFMHSLDSSAAEFIGVRTRAAAEKRAVFSQFDPPGRQPGSTIEQPPGVGAARVRQLEQQLRSFDLVGVLERFDETLLMLADLTGLQHLLYTRKVPENTNKRFARLNANRRTIDIACPDLAACKARVKAVAPVDALIYERAAADFDARVRAMGPGFARRLKAFRAANQRYSAAMSKVEGGGSSGALSQEAFRRRRAGERWVGAPKSFHHKVPMRRLQCDLGVSATAREGCQRAYADTPYRFNWRHSRESCLDRVAHCSGLRVSHPHRVPFACHKWLPSAALVPDPRYRKLKTAAEKQAHLSALNATLRALTTEQCARPPRGEAAPQARYTGAPYRAPSAADEASAAKPRLFSTAAPSLYPPCNDTPSAPPHAAAPWADFGACEGEVGEAYAKRTPIPLLMRTARGGPCAFDVWVRLNCRRSCGLCALSTRAALALPAEKAAARAQQAVALKRGTRRDLALKGLAGTFLGG